ncbi:MAG: radical SAM protein [Candidatus Nanoarchaeia archaeon]|nr:radical SAM protein [Candidatus Nanoarchaeia archaeon]
MPKVSRILEKGFQFLTKGEKALTPPFYAVIEVNDRCCLRCKQCNLWKRVDKLNQEYLTESEIVKLIRDIRKWNPLTKTLMFCGGEPFLEKGIFRYIQVAKRLKFFTTITTNGFLIDEDMAYDIVDSGLDELCFSLDAPEAKIHDNIRGVKGSFDRLIKANELINKAKRELNRKTPSIRVNTVISNLNYKYLPLIPSLLRKMGIKEYAAQYITVVSPEIKEATDRVFRRAVCPKQWILPKELLIPKEEENEFWKTISMLEKRAKENNINLSLRLYNKMQPCSILWGSLLVDSYGNVLPCTMLRDIAGNIRGRNVKSIWNNEKMKNARKLFNQGKLNPICTRCCIYPNVMFR